MKSTPVLLMLIGSALIFQSCKKTEKETVAPAANVPSIFTQPLPAAPQTTAARSFFKTVQPEQSANTPQHSTSNSTPSSYAKT
jgi:hypothetical protein